MKRIALGAAALLLTATLTPGAQAQPAPPTQVSTDPYTNPENQHQTEVEPDTFSQGDSVLSAFMVGRTAGGSANIGWAFSADAGHTWASGFLPGMTRHSSPAGPADRVADPSIAYDAAHGVWLISSLAVEVGKPEGTAIFVNRSPDGVNWEGPLTASDDSGGEEHDKNWVACDNTPASPHFGRCYIAWTNFREGGVIKVIRSTDGGLIWSIPVVPDGAPAGFGVQPVVQPNGTVVIVSLSRLQRTMQAVRSIDGGFSFGPATQFTEVRFKNPRGLRNNPFPTVEVDRSGRIYAAWQDCRFRNLCVGGGNDTVLSTSDDGLHWTPVRAIRPAVGDAVPPGADFLQPGLAVDALSSGDTARLGLYVYYTDTACGALSGECSLNLGFTYSTDGGRTWSSAARVSPEPMPFSWLALSDTGRMIGDYISASFAGGRVVAVHPLASQPPEPGTFRQAMFASALTPDPPPGQAPPGPVDTGGLGGVVNHLLTLLLQLLPGL